MKKLFLHIGAHRTGSTVLQQYLHINRDGLAAQGVLYPQSADHHYGQHRLGLAMFGKQDQHRLDVPDFDETLIELYEEIDASPCETAIVSSEVLFSASRERIAALHALLTDYETRIIAYIRRQDDLFISQYNQLCKSPMNGFSASYRRFLDDPASLHADLDFKACLDNWAGAFGTGAITVRAYDPALSIEQDICEVLGLSAGDLQPLEERANTSISLQAQEFIRLLKKMAPHEDDLRHLSKLAIRHFEDATAIDQLLSSQERKQILTHFESGNTALFKTYLGRQNDFSPDIVEAGAASQTLNIGDVMSLLVSMQEKTRKRRELQIAKRDEEAQSA